MVNMARARSVAVIAAQVLLILQVAIALPYSENETTTIGSALPAKEDAVTSGLQEKSVNGTSQNNAEFGIVNARSIPSNTSIPQWPGLNVTIENVHIIQERNESEKILINNVAYRGNAVKDYQIGLRQMNLFMRQNYNEMITRVGHNVYPLVVATDVDHDKKLSGTGSEYILYLRNGSIFHMKPTPVEYEQNKNLAHIPMSIFTIISPYFNNPTSTLWHEKQSQLLIIITNNLEALKSASNSATPFAAHVFCDDNLTREDHKIMLTMVYDYITSCFRSQSVDIETYKEFTAKYLPFTEKAMTCASQIQARAAIVELSKWKDRLGPKMWRELYVVIPVVWPVARLNPRQQIFEKLMDKDRIATHILKAEGAESVEEARVVAGRIIADRSMAHFVFGYNNLNHTDMNLSLSTRRDLVATRTNAVLEDEIEKYRTGWVPEVSPNELHFQNDY